MTPPLRKPHSSRVSFEFRGSGFGSQKGSTINPPSPGGDVLARAIFARLASETFLSGLQKKPIETP